MVLMERGFLVIPSRIPRELAVEMPRYYDGAVAGADAADVSRGRSCTRVHDFVNRGAVFDRFWLDSMLLEMAASFFKRPFKLGTFHGRAVNPGGAAQGLHVDKAWEDGEPSLLGFIWMIDAFSEHNGATRFVARSGDVIYATGPAGSLIVYDGAVEHGYAANRSDQPRRSLQGAFGWRSAPQWVDLKQRLRDDTKARLSAQALALLDCA